MITDPAPVGPGACSGNCGNGSRKHGSRVQSLTVTD